MRSKYAQAGVDIDTGNAIVRDIKRKTRKRYGAEEKIRIVLEGLRGEMSIAELCRREGLDGIQLDFDTLCRIESNSMYTCSAGRSY